MGNNKYGNIEEGELQSELDKETREGKTEATDIGDEFEVVFIDSNRYYTVDKDGNVGEGQEIIKDKNPAFDSHRKSFFYFKTRVEKADPPHGPDPFGGLKQHSGHQL